MKIGRFNDGRIGVIVGDTIVDVSAACGVDPAEWPPVGIIRVIANFERLRPAIERAAAGPGVPLSAVRLEPPITWPRNLLALPNNFRGSLGRNAGPLLRGRRQQSRRERGRLFS